MPELDLIIRIGAGSVLLLVSTLGLRVRHASPLPWLFVLLTLGLCGFLARNTGDPGLVLTGPAASMASVLSGCAAAFLWWFCLALFDDRFRPGAVAWVVGALWIAVALVDRIGSEPFDSLQLSQMLVAIGVGMVAHLFWRLLRDREGDLLESRRRARWWLVAVLSALLLVDLGVDVVMGFAWKPVWFALTQNATILAFGVFLAHGVLRVDVGSLWSAAPATPQTVAVGGQASDANAAPGTPSPADAGTPTSTADQRLLRRIDELIRVERVHRDPALSFAGFAARLGASEQTVRRLVNQTLGYRHFRTFLNSCRVADARAALSAPDAADRKLVAIAFDAGFASLASFNRAFKDIVGRSPSEFRAAASPDDSAHG